MFGVNLLLLGDGKIQYAFVRVKESTEEIPKFVFIGWCGEGVPQKNLFGLHVGDVAKFLGGFHVQINARHEEDVRPEVILQKVHNASGSKYSIHKEVKRAEAPPAPVSSVYQKTVVDLKRQEPEVPKLVRFVTIKLTMPGIHSKTSFSKSRRKRRFTKIRHCK
jgi:hypothetical protein